MAHLQKFIADATETINTSTVKDVKIESFNQDRPRIKQIGSAIADIVKHVLKEPFNVYPRGISYNPTGKLLHKLLTDMNKEGLAYVSHNLSVSANISTEPKPEEAILDVFLIVQGHPATVFSVVKDEDCDSVNVKRYTLSLARCLNDCIRKFTTEVFSVLYGLVTMSDLNSDKEFSQALWRIKEQSSRLCVPKSLSMLRDKFLNLVQAFLSAIAITSSVVSDDITLWFLTLEEFNILTENIDHQNVIVRTAPSTGRKVLMREVARRLERSGPTLLLLDSEEEIQVARSQKICSYILTVQELLCYDGAEILNVVTNLQHYPGVIGTTGRMWSFISTSAPTKRIPEPVDESCSVDIRASKLSQNGSPSNLKLRIEELEKNKLEAEQEYADLKKSKQKEKQKFEIEKKNLQDEIVRQQLIEKDLSSLLESISVGGLSLDSGVGSDTSSLTGSSSSLVSQEATGGQTQGLLKIFGRKLSRKKLAVKDVHCQTFFPVAPPVYTGKGLVFCLMNLGSLFWLQCTQQEMDTERVNTKYCHVAADGRLVNSPHSCFQGAFKLYRGTCGTSPIHLSFPPVPLAPQYWETETTVGLKRRQELWPILEIGVAEENTVDSAAWVCDIPRSWCVMVRRCVTHRYICTQVWNQRERGSCVRDTISNNLGTYTLRYGVVVDVVRGRVGFVDVDRGAVLGKMDVEFEQTIYPMFGVLSFPKDATVEMRLLSESNITMTEDKLKLIYSCLS